MPCYEPVPTPRQIRHEQQESNFEKYGMRQTDNEIISILINVACEMGNLIEDNDLLWQLSEEAREWHTNHMQFDHEKRQQKLRDLQIKQEELKQKLSKNNAELAMLNMELEKLQD